MKNILIILLTLTVSLNISSQWLEDVRLTNNSSSSNNPEIVSNEQYVHVVWTDDRDGNEEIYYKRSTNYGANWSNDERLTIQTNFSRFPCIAVSGSKVFVVWTDERNGSLNSEIYLKKSTDFGATWSEDLRVSNNAGSSNIPALTNNGDLICIAWEDNRDGNTEIYSRRSPDGGVSWGAETRLTNNSANSQNASISISSQNVFVTWNDNRDGNFEIYYIRSLDGGISWGSEMRLTNNSGWSSEPSVSNSGQFVLIGWKESSGSSSKNYYKKSTNNGSTWTPEYQLSSNSSTSYAPVIVITGTNLVHSVWLDRRNGGNFEIFYKSSFDSAQSWSTDLRLTTLNSQSPDICYSDTNINVVWSNNATGTHEIFYKRNPNGNPIGVQQISTEVPAGFSLGQNYPNPFNPSTSIRFSIPKSENVKVNVYDITGKEIALLLNEKLSAGVYEISFDASDLSSGTYFYSIRTGGFTETKKMIVIK